jgi:type II secretory pathway pseudopilin PulG
MAIMAILAVTLAPRLSQYIDKARQANDREIPNAVYTAVKLGLLDENIQKTVTNSGSTATKWLDGVDILDAYYDNSTTADTYARNSVTPDLLGNEIVQTLGSFKLQSDLANAGNSKIIVKVSDVTKGLFTVEFYYSGTTPVYTMNSADVVN